MPQSSILHDFIIKDEESANRLIEILLGDKCELPSPVKSVSRKEEMTRFMNKWKDTYDKSYKL